MKKEDFEKFYLQTKDKWIRYVENIVKDRDISEDIVQETFIKFYNNIDKIRNPEGFLYKALKNRSIDYLRKKKREKRVEFDEEKHSLYVNKDPIKLFLIRKRLEEEIEKLPDALREVFILRDIEGYSYEEISRILSIPLGTVKSRISRARLHLRERLKNVL